MAYARKVAKVNMDETTIVFMFQIGNPKWLNKSINELKASVKQNQICKF